MASAKVEILRRVAAANGVSAGVAEVAAAWDRLAREYRRGSAATREEVLQLLEDRLRDYDATVVRCGRAEVAGELARMLTARGKRRMVVPGGLAPGTLPEGTLPEGFEFVVDAGESVRHLDAVDGLLSESTLAIAETGTVLLQHGPGQGRRAISLVPDYHLCLVDANRVVATVPEAFAAVQSTAHLATTLVSGPSATADIEMTRIKGVHGPRVLDILLIC